MLFLHNVAQASNQLVFSTGYFFIFEKGKNIVSQIYQKLSLAIKIRAYFSQTSLI